MATAFIITLTLIIGLIAFFLKKKLSFVHNAILLMVMGIITKNYMTIISLQLNLVKYTEKPSLFLYLILYREVVIPLIIVIYLNLNIQIKGLGKKFLLFLITLSFFGIMDFSLIYFKAKQYIMWNFYYSIFANIGFLILALVISKLLEVIAKKDRQNHDRYL